jgi:uncharacterized membrane protein YbhN (UPF0104 family)
VDDRAGPQGVARPRRRVLRLVLGAAITAALAGLIAAALPSGDVAAAMRSVDPLWFGPLAGAYALTFVFRAARFRALGLRLPLVPLTGVATIHQFMNRILPLRAGELALPVLARRLCGTSMTEGLALVALGHLLDLAFIALAFLAALLAVPGARAAIGPAGTALVAAAIPVLLAAYLALPSAGSAAARRIAERLAPAHPRAAEGFARAARTLADLRSVSRTAFLAAAFWTALQWAATFALFWAAVAAVGIDAGPAEVVLGSTAAVLAAVLPIGGIGTFGTLEGGWAAGFILVGVAEGPAWASAFVMSGTTFLVALAGSAVAWAALRGRRPR